VLSPLAAVSAFWVKYNWFALTAYAGVLREVPLKRHPRLALAALLVLASSAGLYVYTVGLTDYKYIASGATSTGSGAWGFGHIGTWRRWIRNVTNIPIVQLGGILGTPACLFVWLGLKKALHDESLAVVSG